ncbi:MAG: hypothetical protein IPJ20_19565 [Flammeovirgaceae bacterium]|nr:hypothetical protein [Flammeovirgaceae bacterium]
MASLVGISNVANVTAGLSVSHDTYQGYGVGAYLGASSKLDKLPGIKGNVQIGISPYGGGGYASAGVDLSIGKSASAISSGLQLDAGISSHSNGINTSAGVGISGYGSHLGSSIRSGSSNPSISGGIGSSSVGVANSKDGQVSTHSENFALDIPIIPGLVNLNLGRSYVRYWIDESESNLVYGSVNMHKMPFVDNKAYDAYSNFSGAYAAASGKSSDELNGGTYADYDNYLVMAQGVSGSIRPYHYRVNVDVKISKAESTLCSKNLSTGNSTIRYQSKS